MKKCYEGDAEQVIHLFKKVDERKYLTFFVSFLAFFILYVIFPDVYFLSELFLFMAVSLGLFIFYGFAVIQYRNLQCKKYSFVKKICFDDAGMHVTFPSQSLSIPFENILYIYPPKNQIGDIGYIIDRGKRKYKEIYLSETLFPIVKDEIINYFRKKEVRPPFVVVMPEERAAMRNKVVWMQTYAVQNKKEKLDKILDEFWSKHRLEEFE